MKSRQGICDTKGVRGELNASGGIRTWPPLLYLVNSRVLLDDADAVAAAGALLDAGADPNAYDLAQDQYKFTCITGAIGEGEAPCASRPSTRGVRGSASR